MKKAIIFNAVFLFACGALAQIYMHFQEPSNLPSDLQKVIVTAFNEKCADAYTYRWTIAESKTLVSSSDDGPENQVTKFYSRFMSITAYMFEFDVVSEGRFNASTKEWSYQVNSLNGTCN